MQEEFISYLITDPKYYSNNEELFKKNLLKFLSKHKVSFACFRDKESSNFKELAKIFVETCREFNIEKVLINSDYTLAHELGANGVHLTSSQFDDIKKAKDLNLYTIISCHSFSDIEKASQRHVNAVTYSPIFKTPNKGEPKGIDNLRQAVKLYEDMDVIALGGIVSDEQVEQIKKTNAFGFASIRYFI